MTTVERHVLPEMNVATLRPVGAMTNEEAPRARLRHVLVGADLAAVLGGWTLALVTAPSVRDSGLGDAFVLVLLLSFVTMLGIASQRLYLARVCTIRAVEINRLGKACAPAVVLALILPRLVAIDLPVPFAVLGGAAAFGAAVVARAGYREFLRSYRRQGRFMRSVIVIGNNDEGLELVRLLDTHPELGFAVAGIIGEHPTSVEAAAMVPHLGPVASADRAVREAGATGVLIAASALTGAQINYLVRAFGRAGVHVHLSSGLRGISHSRMRSHPLAHEPLFYVEAPKLAPWQFQTKRLLDLLFASVAFVMFLPFLAISALLIKLQDRGPVFYRQTRIGKDGVPFRILKLRTMHVDADRVQLKINEREGGPLFKATSDPRRTRVGTVLERLSLDEAPQLINVLKGEMSLVGPRPALPREVAMFDEELRSRHSVLPGITGLWQVEARENPSFGAYRRYDLFYIENWTISLDLAILVATAQSVLFRAATLFKPPKRTASMKLVPGYAERP